MHQTSLTFNEIDFFLDPVLSVIYWHREAQYKEGKPVYKTLAPLPSDATILNKKGRVWD